MFPALNSKPNLFIAAFITFIVSPFISQRDGFIRLINAYRFSNLCFGVFIIALCSIFALRLMSCRFISFLISILLVTVGLRTLLLVLDCTFVSAIHIFP